MYSKVCNQNATRAGRQVNGMNFYNKKRGSYSVEAALIFPLGFMPLTIFLYLYLMVDLEFCVQQGLYNVADNLYPQGTAVAYVKNSDIFSDRLQESINNSFDNINIKDEWLEALVEKGISYLYSKDYIKKNFEKYCDDNKINLALIKDGASGIDFSSSEVYSSKGLISIIASYTIKFPGSMLGVGEKQIKQRVYLNSFYGRDWDKSDEFKNELVETKTEVKEEYVYVTKHGTVYHRDENCSFIIIKADKVPYKMIDKLRSKNNSKYYPCEICVRNVEPGVFVYITDYGTRYHLEPECKQLSHACEKLELAMAMKRGLGPCAKCGKKTSE